MSFGNVLMLSGIIMAAAGGIGLVASSVIFHVKKKNVEKKLYDRYGF